MILDKEIVEALEKLRMDAWGYEHLFESSFHSYVFYELTDILVKAGVLEDDR